MHHRHVFVGSWSPSGHVGDRMMKDFKLITVIEWTSFDRRFVKSGDLHRVPEGWLPFCVQINIGNCFNSALPVRVSGSVFKSV